ncbi:hypothetical protein [Fluviispira multicolorata]|uniref:Uncharacterized protein n=1 Tax=Fluviispira multicolorata TaxID=2654512 RepID=A0A833N2E4_9BACT|nr:hypothetical protein [Fluviispira multicolorata]KAB8032167.1 hypothetical protein GCL57_05845 [Fluviispira multicolorata]
MAFFKSIFFIIFCLFQFKLFATEKAYDQKIEHALNKQKSKLRIKKIKTIKMYTKVFVVTPSTYYTPDFYNQNDLNNIFLFVQKVRQKVEKPIQFKEVNLKNNTEMSFATHLDTGNSFESVEDFKVSIEIKAKFL